MLFTKVKTVTRHIHRYRQILQILIAHGLGDILESLGLNRRSRHRFKKSSLSKQEFKSETRAQRIRQAIEQMGTTFIKLAQIASTRTDLLPKSITEELTKLQDTVTFIPFSEFEGVIATELGEDWQKHFSFVDKEPLAAASIAQVHRATLLSGEEVVLKVQRPNIQQTIKVDLEILHDIAQRLSDNPKFADYQPLSIIKSFADSFIKELDFTDEMANTQRFQENFKEVETIHSPVIYQDFCTTRVLCSEFVTGIKPDIDVADSLSPDIRTKAAALGANCVMQQVFIDGFFHGDPHPGNLLIQDNGDITFIDFGQVGRVNKRDRETFALLIQHLTTGNIHGLTLKLLNLTTYNTRPNIEVLEDQVGDLIDTQLSKEIEQIDSAQLLNEILSVVSENKLALKPQIYLMLKALATVEGVARQLDPHFRLVDHIRVFAKKLWLKRMNPSRISQDTLNYISDSLGILKDLPNDVEALLNKIRQDKLRIELEHTGTEDLVATANQISDRLTFAIIQGSIIIGSSLIVHAKLPPYWHDVPIIGLLGFIIAGVLGVVILVMILRQQRHK